MNRLPIILAGDEVLNRFECLGALDDHLAHVGDVEEADILPDGFVLGNDARKLDGQFPADKGNEFRPSFRMNFV